MTDPTHTPLTAEELATIHEAIKADCPPHPDDEWLYCSHGAAYHIDRFRAAIEAAAREPLMEFIEGGLHWYSCDGRKDCTCGRNDLIARYGADQ